MTHVTAERNEQARAHVCPTCHAPVGEPCTQPTDIGRKPVKWIHSARLDLAYGWNV